VKTVSVTDAKQRLGALLSSIPPDGVAIQRRGKTVALLVLPDSSSPEQQAAREARNAQALVEQQRLNRHLRIGLELLSDPDGAETLMAAASREVDRWQSLGLCSADYIDRWRSLLALEPSLLAPRVQDVRRS
jgi:thioesterase domain-containing protein